MTHRIDAHATDPRQLPRPARGGSYARGRAGRRRGLAAAKVLIGLAFVAGLGLILWALFGRPSDEERVVQTLQTLAAGLRIEPGEAPMPRALRVRNAVKEALTEDATVRVPEASAKLDRKDAAALAAQQAAQAQSGGVTLSKLSVRITGDRAEVEGHALAEGFGGGRREERDFIASLRKESGDWRIERLDVRHPGDDDEEDPTE